MVIVVDEVSALELFVLFVVVVLLWRILCISLNQVYLYPDRVVVRLMWRWDPLVSVWVLWNPPSMVLNQSERLGSLSIVRVIIRVMTGLSRRLEVYSVVRYRGVNWYVGVYYYFCCSCFRCCVVVIRRP